MAEVSRFVKLRILRKAAGLCMMCGKSPKRLTSNYCQQCAVASQERNKKLRKNRRKKGICDCGRDLTVLDDKNCLVCLERKNNGRPWR